MFMSFSTYLFSRFNGHGCVSRSSVFLRSSRRKHQWILRNRSLTKFIPRVSVGPLHSGLRGRPELYESRGAELVLLAGFSSLSSCFCPTGTVANSSVFPRERCNRRQCCLGDYIPAFTIRQGRSLHEESAMLNLIIEALERNRGLLSPPLAERDRWIVVNSPGDAFGALCIHPSGEQSCVCFDETMKCELMALVRTQVRVLDFKRNQRW